MANRVMAAKAVKLRKQRRRYPRRMDLDKRGPRPNREVIAEYAARAETLGTEWIDQDGYGEYSRSKIPFHSDAMKKFDDPHFVVYFDSWVEHIRIWFNSRQDKVIIVRIRKLARMYCLSEAFATIDDAYFAIKNDCVPWKDDKPFPNPDQPTEQ